MKKLVDRAPGATTRWRILVCTECGKEMAHYYAFAESKKSPPDWVTF